MKPIQTKAPVDLPVDIAEFKQHLYVDYDDYDSLIMSYLTAATQHLDGYTGILGRCIMDQEWDLPLGGLTHCIPLPFTSVKSARVFYFDKDNNEQEMDSGDFEVVTGSTGSEVMIPGPLPELSTTKIAKARISMLCGYGRQGDVPYPLKVAIMQLAAHWWEHREGASEVEIKEVPMAVDRLIAPYRMVFF